jgi:hypothetical protein
MGIPDQCPYGAFYGQISEHRGGHIDFMLYNPSEEIRRHKPEDGRDSLFFGTSYICIS